MLEFFVKKMKKNKGFTLIELVVVIAILGILSAVAVPRFIGIQEEAKISADQASAKTIASALSIAIAGGYAEIDDTGITFTDDTLDGSKIVEYLVELKYLDSEPTPQTDKTSSFDVTAVDGGIVVKVGKDIFYPKYEEGTDSE